MTTNSTVKSLVKEVFVLRIANDVPEDGHNYLNDQSFVGYRFTESFKQNLMNVVKETLNNQKASDLRGTDAICRFDTVEEAESLLSEVYESYYNKNKEELTGNEFEIVRVSIIVEEQVVKKINKDER